MSINWHKKIANRMTLHVFGELQSQKTLALSSDADYAKKKYNSNLLTLYPLMNHRVM